MPAIVTPRGQITIDQEIRKRLGVQPGMVAVQQVVGGHLVVVFLPAPHRRSPADRLGSPPRPAKSDWEAIEATIAGAIADEADRRG